MNRIRPFSNAQIESLSKVLGECGTGSEITSVLMDMGLSDHSAQSTKWRRLNAVFRETQVRDKCANRILDFIQRYLAPERFVGENDEFEGCREQVNVVLAFAGLEYRADGQFEIVREARTLTESERRVSTIRAKFHGRRIHPDALKYCRPELMDDNYFHAVFEATKGLAQRIREMSSVEADGSALVDAVFSTKRPVLAFNSLQTETEKSEHRGFANLLRGCFALIRNPRAHEPKIMWQENENDAADYFTLISLLHWKLDRCFPTGIERDS